MANSTVLNSSVSYLNVSNASLVNTYVVNSNTVNSSVTNFSAVNASLVNTTAFSSTAINFSSTNSSFQNIYVGNIFSLTGASYSLSGSGGMANTSYIEYDNNVSSMSLKANSINLNTNSLSVGDNSNDSNIIASDIALKVLNSFGLKVNASNVLILDTSGNTTLGNSYTQTNINSSKLLLVGSTLQAVTNGYNILSADQNNTLLGNSVGSITINGSSVKCNPKCEITNVSGVNASYTNVYVGGLYSLNGTEYTLGGSATNTSYITYDNNASDMNISANNLILNSSTYISGTLQVFGAAKASSFQATSDKRVKINIEDLNRVTSLDILRQLKPKTYDFIDSPKNQLGFIAQEIKSIDLLRPSIHEGPGFIPNIYHTVTCKDGMFTTDTTLHQGDHIRYKINGKPYTTSIVNASSPQYKMADPISGDVFLYGTEVPDFHSMEKDMIFTLSVAAIQQLDEIVSRQQTSIDKLKSLAEKQQKTIDFLLKKIDATLVP
jgi:hypothetical protein